MRGINLKYYERKLKKAMKEARMSEPLRYAIKEILEAIKKKDLELLYELTMVKSLITSNISNESYFEEDYEYNKTVIGESLYSILDSLHHDVAYAMDKLPGGMVIISSEGRYEKTSLTKRDSPTLKLIENELKRIYSNYLL